MVGGGVGFPKKGQPTDPTAVPSSSATVAARAGAFLTPGKLGGEYGATVTGPFLLGQPAPLAARLTGHIADPNFGVFLEVGQLSDPTGKILGPVVNANVVQGGTFADDQASIYVNEQATYAGAGSVANKDVTGATTVTGLVGGAYDPNVINAEGKTEPGPLAVGGELYATYATGTPKDPTLGSTRSSVTVAADVFLTRSYNANLGIFGVAIGGAYETGGGGFSVGIKIGIGGDAKGAPPPIFGAPFAPIAPGAF